MLLLRQRRRSALSTMPSDQAALWRADAMNAIDLRIVSNPESFLTTRARVSRSLRDS